MVDTKLIFRYDFVAHLVRAKYLSELTTAKFNPPEKSGKLSKNKNECREVDNHAMFFHVFSPLNCKTKPYNMETFSFSRLRLMINDTQGNVLLNVKQEF